MRKALVRWVAPASLAIAALLLLPVTGAVAQTAAQSVSGFLLAPSGTYNGYTCPSTNIGPCFVQYGATIPTSGGSSTQDVQGNVASGATDSGNPVKTGGVFNTTAPTVTNGQRVDSQTTNRGETLVTVSNAGTAAQVSAQADDTSNSVNGLVTRSNGALFDGTTWDRQRDSTISNATTGTGISAAGAMGKYNTSLPSYTDGQFGNIQLGVRGSIRVAPVTSNAPASDDFSNNAMMAYQADTAQAGANYLTQGAGYLFDGTTWDRARSVEAASASGVGVTAVSTATTSASPAAALNTSTSALAANLVVKASAGNLYGFNVSVTTTLSAAAWYVIVYNAATAPSDGAITPQKCYAIPAGTTSLNALFQIPQQYSTGITIGVSTSGCFTKTASTQAFISADYR